MATLEAVEFDPFKRSPLDAALEAEGVKGPLADVARSIYMQESAAGKNTKTSNRGAVGGMQILPGTFSGVADKDWDINDPTQNARAGIRYLKQGYEASGGDPALAGAFYYGGPGGLEKARRGVAVSDPKNPSAPNTLQYGAQVAARIPKEKGLLQRGVEAIIPSAEAATGPTLEPVDFDPFASAGAPSAPKESASQTGGAAFGVYPNARRQAKNNTPNALDAIAMGVARGVKDPIDTGAELLATGYDKLTGNGPNVSGLVTGQQGEGARIRAMNQQGKQDFADQYRGSALASAGRVGGNILATLPVGPALGAGAKAVGLSRFGNALTSGGMTVGGAPAANMAQGAANIGIRMAGGGATGAVATGLIDPDSIGTGALVGAALPPVARVAGAVGGAARGAVNAVRDMATQAGQERIAANILQRSATNPEAAAKNLLQARPLVPGSNPTIGQVAQDPGLAQLERTLVNNPDMAAPLQRRFAEQRAARTSAIDDVAASGPNSGSYYDDIKEGRRIFAKEDYEKALNAKVDPEKAKELQPQIADLIERPSIKSAMEDAKRLAAETGENITDFGSIRGLDWVNRALDNKISIAKGGNSSIGKADLAALQQTKRDLMATLEHLSPDYKEAITNYAKMSRQVNSMDVARQLDKAYTPVAANFGPSAKEQGNAFMKALDKAKDSVKGATGRDASLADVMNTQDIYALENVGRDMARKQYAESAGSATGSPTAQNMLSQHLISRILGDAGIPQSVVNGAQSSTLVNTMLRPVEFAGRLAMPKIQNRLAELALSPEEAAIALRALTRNGPQTANALSLGRLGAGAESLAYKAAPALSSR